MFDILKGKALSSATLAAYKPPWRSAGDSCLKARAKRFSFLMAAEQQLWLSAYRRMNTARCFFVCHCDDISNDSILYV
jgi:hypothetical protein